MFLNLMMLKMRAFLPGRDWMKKGLPLLSKNKPIVTKINIGPSSNELTKATVK